jgi:8-oxo-dGTP pyrophosphatase MutT (NUDIX family)
VVSVGGREHFLFEVRAGALRHQPGETCFPGGRTEQGETPEACALRETEEELAIPRQQIELAGKTDFLCSPAGFLLQPVVGLVSAAGLAAMIPSPAEVAEVFTVPVSFFAGTPPEVWTNALEPRIADDFPFDQVGISPDYRWARGAMDIPVWHYGRHVIWGMTGRIVRGIVGAMGL